MAAAVTTEPTTSAVTGTARGAWRRFWYADAPLERLSVFRLLIYAYLPLDVLTSLWVADHGLLPASWYAPLWIGRALRIPAPTAVGMAATAVAIIVLSPFGARGKGRRFVGPALLLLYGYWCFVAFTYGKVDHDRVALLTALAVLPTAPWTGTGPDVRAGWALRMVQASFALTYFLAGVTKILVGGWGWATSTTLERAIARRGTLFARWLLGFPRLLHAMQVGILAFELTALLMLLRNRLGRAYVAMAVAFHAVTFIGITIYFRSHLICVLAFLPLERSGLLRGWSGAPPEAVERAEEPVALDHVTERHDL